MTTKIRLSPDSPTHPGEVLADELDARGLSASQLAVAAGGSPTLIEAVLAGRASIDAAFALQLESVLHGISARFWMGLQADFDLARERLARRTESP